MPIVFAIACGKKADEPPPAPFAGPLTVERIMAAKDTVKVFDTWSSALPKLEAKLGKPTKIDDKTGDHKWAVVDGDRCAYIEFSSGDGKEYGKTGLIVDGVQAPMTVDKSGPPGNRVQCLEIAGKTDVPPEDPNAAGPPADGVVAPSDFDKLALAARSKWEGKQIKVTGKVTGFGGLLVNIEGAKCIQKTNADPSLMDQTVTAAGTVRFTKGMTGAGEPTQDVELADCVVTGSK